MKRDWNGLIAGDARRGDRGVFKRRTSDEILDAVRTTDPSLAWLGRRVRVELPRAGFVAYSGGHVGE